MHPPYPRAELERRVLERVEGGWTLDQIEAEPGFPSRMTVFRWAKADPGFAQRLKDARAWRRGMRTAAREAASYNEPVAEALLLRVRRGEAVRDLVRDPAMPGRDQLNRWKRERPDFAARLEEAWRFAWALRRRRPLKWPVFDEAAADRIVVRVAAGEPLPKVLADPTLPGETAVRRWRALWPEFDAALETAKLAGHRRRMRGRRRLTPELQAKIERRILAGASLLAVSRASGIPHYVTLHAWLRRDPAFARAVRLAERLRDDLMVDRAMETVRAVTEVPAEATRREIEAIRRQVGRMARKGRA